MLLAVPDEHVERDEARRDLGRQLSDAALGRVKPGLHRVEVEHPVADDHDLAVEARPRRKNLAERSELREVPQQGTCVARPQAELAGGVLEQSPEAVPFRLVLPLVPLGQVADELRLHRREGDRGIEVGRTLDGLAASACARHGATVPRPSSHRVRPDLD